jgi:ribosomal protein S18 acetylase RimI-like enzyme
MDVHIQLGVPNHQRSRLARIFYEAFHGKFGRFLAPQRKAELLVSTSLRNDRILVAYHNQQAVGFAGLHYRGKNFMEPTLTHITRIYGWATVRVSAFFAFTTFQKPGPRQLILEALAVAKSHRNQGIGTQLLQATIGYARNHQLSPVTLDVIDTNREAKQLYPELGFTTTHNQTIPYPFNILLGFTSVAEMQLTS